MIESTASRQGPCDQPIYEDEQIRGDSLSCTDKTFPTFSLCASANGSFLPPFFIALVDFSLNPVSIVPGQTATKGSGRYPHAGKAKSGVEYGQHRHIHFNLQKSHYRNPEVVLEITRNAPKNLTPLPLPPSLAHSTAHVLKAAKPAVLVAEYNILVGAGTRAATEERW
jgi:hypothetical protein